MLSFSCQWKKLSLSTTFLASFIIEFVVKHCIKIMAGQVYCMVMKVNVDCNACCRKMRRILQNMKEIEKHVIEKQHYRVTVYGRYVPADVAIKIRRKMKRRVEILQVHDLSGGDDRDQENSPGEQPEMQYA